MMCFFLLTIIVSSDGLRESQVTTRFFDVNDMYSESYREPSDEYYNGEPPYDDMDKSPVSFVFLNKIIIFGFIT